MDQKSIPQKRVAATSISASTRERAEAAKAYIQGKYFKLKRQDSEKRECWDELNNKMSIMNLSEPEKQIIKQEILHKDAEQMRLRRQRMTVYDFESIAIIGKGAFGEVRVVRNKQTGEIQAMKKMIKSEMICKNQIMHVRAERNILSIADNFWIVDLKYSFQDENSLYLIMEYLPGGDLMSILMKRDILPEVEAKFYIAETIMAVESVHKLNYIHRDIKPDNVLIDKTGHVKLSDFGLCKHTHLIGEGQGIKKINEDELRRLSTRNSMEFKRTRILAFSTVGTPDYIAPEVFGKQGYNETVDWWSVGVILYEMIIGYPPFFADEPSLTCKKIMHWKKTLHIPKEAGISKEASDLIKKLICDPDERLGSRGVEEIKNHAFFRGIDWDRLRESKSPWIPKVKII